MNQPITRLFVVFMLLFGGLALSTTWWTVVKADELNTQKTSQNKRELLRGLKIRRGIIRDADGGIIARSVRGAPVDRKNGLRRHLDAKKSSRGFRRA